jgi:hypothetical protein
MYCKIISILNVTYNSILLIKASISVRIQNI